MMNLRKSAPSRGRRWMAAVLILQACSAGDAQKLVGPDPGPAASPTLRSLSTQRNLIIGTSTEMSPLNSDTTYRRILSAQYAVITPGNELKFGPLSPSPGVYRWTDADAIVAFADAHGMTVHGHTLVWDQQQPQWLTTGTFTRAQLLTILHDHITTVVSRYQGRIRTWDVVNEALDDNGAWRRSQWYTVIGPDYVDSAFVWARRADPGAGLYYNDYGAESMTPKADSVLQLVSRLRSRGIPVDGVGLQMHLSLDAVPAVSSVLQNMSRLAQLGVDIRVSEFDVRIAGSQADSTALAQQATVYADMLGACLSVPQCRSFTSWGFTDRYSWIPVANPGWGSALPFDTQYQPKPAFFAMMARLSGS
jgi:endo-1,4-beta-xylanase